MSILDRSNVRLFSRVVVAVRHLVDGTMAPTDAEANAGEQSKTIALPSPDLQGEMTLEHVLGARRSSRDFSSEPLSSTQLSQLLWAAQGVTSPEGRRTAPSAGATYPLQLYICTPAGLYHYWPQEHLLESRSARDLRPTLYWACQCRAFIRQAPALFVIAADYERVSRQYGPNYSPMYVHMECGHAGQNLLLQAVALGLAAVPVAGFFPDQVKLTLSLPPNEQPLYLVSVGHKAQALAPP